MKRLGAVTSFLLALGLAAAMLIGPIGLTIVRFHMSPGAIAQYVGGEVAMVVVIGALLLAASWWWRADPRAPALSLGAALYAIYTMMTVVLPQEYQQYPDGNAEDFFVGYTAITAVAVVLAGVSINGLLQAPATADRRRLRATRIFLAVQAALFFVLWTGQIIGVYRTGLSADAEQTRLLFWMIKFIDLGIVIPLSLLTVYLLRTAGNFAVTMAIGISGFTLWMMLALAAMMTNQWLEDQPGSSLPLAGVMLLLATWAGAVLWRWLADRRPGADREHPAERPLGLPG